MPKNLFQEIVFTIIMVFFMVYAMICYNIAIATGEFTNKVFLMAFHELTFMGPIAFVLDFFIVGHIAKKIAFNIVDLKRDNPFHLVIAISVLSCMFMCPLMSMAATIILKHPGSEFFSVWVATTIKNFPMALLWQLCFAGPVVRFIFGLIFRDKQAA